MIHRLERWAALALLLLCFFMGVMLGMVLDAALPRQRLRKDNQ